MQIEFERASVSAETYDAMERGVALLVPDARAVRVLVTGSFEQAIRHELADHPEAESFTADRLSGAVAGKTICGATESVIVALEEYRIERALHQRGLPADSDHWSDMPTTLFNFLAQFVDGLALRYPNEPVKRTHDTLLGATQQLAVKLHYLAAQDPRGGLPDDPVARGLWQRFVGVTWPSLTALTATVPDAATPWPADQLDACLLQLTAHRRDWFAELGFRLEPQANPEDYYFRVLLSDAQWKSLVNEALAADAYYRKRDAS